MTTCAPLPQSCVETRSFRSWCRPHPHPCTRAQSTIRHGMTSGYQNYSGDYSGTSSFSNQRMIKSSSDHRTTYQPRSRALENDWPSPQRGAWQMGHDRDKSPKSATCSLGDKPSGRRHPPASIHAHTQTRTENSNGMLHFASSMRTMRTRSELQNFTCLIGADLLHAVKVPYHAQRAAGLSGQLFTIIILPLSDVWQRTHLRYSCIDARDPQIKAALPFLQITRVFRLQQRTCISCNPAERGTGAWKNGEVCSGWCRCIIDLPVQYENAVADTDAVDAQTGRQRSL